MCDEMKCPGPIDWGAYLMADCEDIELLRRHVATCPACRASLEGCFPLEAASEGTLSQHAPASLTAGVLGAVPGLSPAGERVRTIWPWREPSLPRRVLAGNYLTAAALTLLLTFTNVFGYLPDLGKQSRRISDGFDAFCSGTLRAVEAGVSGDGFWLRLCPLVIRNRVKKGE